MASWQGWCGIAWLVLQAVAWYAMVPWYGPVLQGMVWQDNAMVWYGMCYKIWHRIWYGMVWQLAPGTWQLARGCSSVVVMVWQGMVWYVMAMVWQ